ncbi:hypothetical protein FB567DRAFT_572874 [Paraphoma chrysanthemicola]|uniref:Fe2OG dioxygenase domain-containing protein n=1 Tax=Paraphoma chrysanthemicola TaxID=798071 RepID=A0A8K0QXG9_9PLEO|nr:hypothetical protein FB567DRAFT_572874 [Paraphoma chrysanthemicola]
MSYPSSVSSDEVSVIDEVTQALSNVLDQSKYACGGAIDCRKPDAMQSFPVLDNPGHPGPTQDPNQALADPIVIRWDAASSVRKIAFPLSIFDPSHGTMYSLEKLVQATEPASFGFEGQDVLDETYRKASKLDTTAFSTNFCPYEVGIIDEVGQTLFPRLRGTFQGIRAELYKLNIYQAPSGFFKPHIDTPRSELQFGSLVVCLPCKHEGGQLVVRHRGHTSTFDWSGTVNRIQWAAFFSDCEHEVLQVTSGHRITLTYNLFVRRGLGELAGFTRTLSAPKLPLHKEVRAALLHPEFLKEAGVSALPAVLKGIDMMAFEVFRSLGIEVLVRPVMEPLSEEDMEDMIEDGLLDKSCRTHNHVGHQLSEPATVNIQVPDEGTIVDAYNEYPSDLMKVTWLNEPNDDAKGVQFEYSYYGNMHETAYAYSSCALLFKIPAYVERVEIAKRSGYFL